MEEQAVSESPKAVPWLVLPYGEGKKIMLFLISLSRKRFWHKHSHQGWLILLCDLKDDDVDCDLSKSGEKDVNSISYWKYGDCLWNPVTLETIQLPSLLEWISKPDDYRMLDCVLSSPPRILDGSDGEDPVVLFLFSIEDTTRLNHVFLFCHPGDKNWRTQLYTQDAMFGIESLHCFKNRLYVICFNEQQLEIEQQQLGADDNHVTLSIKPFKVSFCSSLAFRGARDNSWSLTYCMECDDEFFKIRIYFNGTGFEKIVISIQITRLDFSLMEWKVVNTLGDHVLFIGKNTRVCCSAAELGLSKGCLYYTLPEDQRLYKFEVESAGDSVILPCLELPTPWYSPEWIMMPAGETVKEVKLGADEKDQDYILKTPEKRANINSYCAVFGIDWSGDGISIFCIRRGEQEWVSFEFDDVSTEKFPAMRNTPVLCNGIFYSAGYDGTLARFSLVDDYWEPLEKPVKQFNDSYPSYLVECGEDLLLVKLGCPEMPVRIFRLDFSDMEWVKLKVWEGICYFRMENKLYFPRLCLNGEGVSFYSLATGCYHSFGTKHFAKDFCGTEGWLGNCTWIEPNWAKSTPQELDWFNSLTVT
ncbi:hypothetical protein MKW98_016500 [Papaver atlanticum]|uniref:KIB1-4 beta-propeller domain-containing protein n=1 Tax=Papaver atlanticum TaxID=357466 RepID=A0AAD4T6N8_9MAGN|nr:hypothetical protein MKW98_016500 [Papaver atlanticum]